MLNQSNKEFEKQRRLLKRAEAMAGIGHWQINLEDETLFWSDEIYKIHGVDKDDYTPEISTAIDFFHPEDQLRVQDYVAQAIDQKLEYFFEMRLIRQNGDVRIVESYGEPELDEGNNVTGVFGIFRDITEERRKEAEREDTKQFLELIMENIPDPIFVKDSEFRIILANSAFLKLYPEEQRDNILGTTTVEDYNPKEAEEFLEQDRKALDKGYAETLETLTFPDGQKRTFFTKKVGLTNSKGERNLLGVVRDISDIQKAQSEIERSNKDLQDFAFTVSHDLKAPLRHISMSASFIEDAIKDKISNDEKEFLKIMTDGAEKAQFMIDNLLEYSRIGQKEQEFTDVDLNIITNNVLSMLALDIEEKDARIHLDKLPIIKGNDGLLIRLFQNIIENSLKYAKHNVKPEIRIFSEIKDNMHKIYISDNGIGISPEFSEKIFLMFQRLHGENSEYKGIGIGLAICQKIVRSHGGTIELNQSYNDGAGFIVSFPVN